jgi:glycosyltransferase involved in cell wall biosynthesis
MVNSLAPDSVRVVAVSAQGLTTPGFRARILLYREELRHHAVFIEPLPLFEDHEARTFERAGPAGRFMVLMGARRRLLRRLHELNGTLAVAMIQRQVDLFPSLRAERVASEQRRLVWDVDDRIWLDRRREAGSHRLAALKRTARRVNWLAERADHIVAANDHLAEYLARFGRKLTVVPSVVDTRANEPRVHEDREELVLGWIGSRTTGVYLKMLTGVLAKVVLLLPRRRVKLLAVGAVAPPIEGIDIENRPWSEPSEKDALARMDIGLMPVPENPWTLGKSAYKAVVYMSAGVPVVADDVGVAAKTIGGGGYVVRGEQSWIEAIVALAKDPALRARLGANGRFCVEERFSVQRWAPALADILRGELTAKSPDAPALIRVAGDRQCVA